MEEKKSNKKVRKKIDWDALLKLPKYQREFIIKKMAEDLKKKKDDLNGK
ncbi:MAG: hypothetical protein Tp1122DCM00d2C27307611_44 [Prokaryotic dsDNA virus sp.]|nr:MAG: hypothetical protein Tp1122DCM00d2C27307611_44 [Prokaryotic dsDNA virus sp.]|tara:strand:- start:20198 stop:20344 length:147 start_codon:yes stop_codon:yes gene_type:complete